jgi:uncharacterized protein (DUF736 family)
MEIGAGWLKKKEVDGHEKQYISAVIEVPFFGRINITIHPSVRRDSEKSPNYLIYWNPDHKKEGDAKHPGSEYSGMPT